MPRRHSASFMSFSVRKIKNSVPPLHPGEILREEFLAPLNLSPGALAKAMGVPRTRVERIAAETSGITANTALALEQGARHIGRSCG